MEKKMTNKTNIANDRDKEITVIDLAKILIRKKILFFSVFFVILILTVIYAYVMPPSYQYTSTYQLAESAPGTALESSQSLIAKTNNIYIDTLKNEYLEEHDLSVMPFEINVNSPANTLLMRLITQAKIENESLIESFHESILEKVLTGQHEYVERRRNNLETRLQATQQSIDLLRDSENPLTTELIARYFMQASDIEESLANLIPGEITHISSRSAEAVGPGRLFILAVGGILSLIIAIGMVFLVSFVGLVKNSLEDDTKLGNE
jgi:hypothetical protein